MTKPTDVTPEVSTALARLRSIAAAGKIGLFSQIAADLNVLDNAGVFAGIDEANDYASAEEILAESALRDVDRQNGLDPEEWGDLTRTDLASHQSLSDMDEHIAADRNALAAHDPKRCVAHPLAGPSLHSGSCPVWQQHHSL